MNAPTKPKMAEIHHVCDSCGKKWHTCHCQALHLGFYVTLALALLAFGVVGALTGCTSEPTPTPAPVPMPSPDTVPEEQSVLKVEPGSYRCSKCGCITRSPRAVACPECGGQMERLSDAPLWEGK